MAWAIRHIYFWNAPECLLQIFSPDALFEEELSPTEAQCMVFKHCGTSLHICWKAWTRAIFRTRKTCIFGCSETEMDGNEMCIRYFWMKYHMTWDAHIAEYMIFKPRSHRSIRPAWRYHVSSFWRRNVQANQKMFRQFKRMQVETANPSNTFEFCTPWRLAVE